MLYKVILTFKVAPYSFTIARALETKVQVICTRSKGNISVFDILLRQNKKKKAKLRVNFLEFPSVKFHKIGRLLIKFYFSRSSFSRKIYKTSFLAAVKDINLKILKKLPLRTPLFSCLKLVSCWMRCAVKILEDFTEGNSRKSEIKP